MQKFFIAFGMLKNISRQYKSPLTLQIYRAIKKLEFAALERLNFDLKSYEFEL